MGDGFNLVAIDALIDEYLFNGFRTLQPEFPVSLGRAGRIRFLFVDLKSRVKNFFNRVDGQF
jgi:hypothetical protein